jgi:hypothetical protein
LAVGSSSLFGYYFLWLVTCAVYPLFLIYAEALPALFETKTGKPAYGAEFLESLLN